MIIPEDFWLRVITWRVKVGEKGEGRINKSNLLSPVS
jgi:hypothetical protein